MTLRGDFPPSGFGKPVLPGEPAPGSPAFDSSVKPFKYPVYFTMPAGWLRTLIIENTPGNVLMPLSPGPGFRWRILMGRLTLVCDATVASRFMRLGIYIPGITGALCPQIYGAAAAANETKTMSFSEQIVTSGGAFSADSAHHGIGQGWILEGTDYLQIGISAGVAGDVYNGAIRVLEVRV